jgi:iron(III) transport system permease protein
MFITILSAGVFSVPGILGRRLGVKPLPLLMYQAIHSYIADFPRVAALGTMLVLNSLALLVAYRHITRVERRFATVSGKGFVQRKVSLGRAKPFAIGLLGLYSLICVVLPNAALVLEAITKYASRDILNLPISFSGFLDTLTRPGVLDALSNTAIVLAVSVPVCIVIAILSVFSMRRGDRRVKASLDYFSSSSLAIPGIVLSAGLLLVYLRTPLYATLGVLIVAYVTHCIPHAFRIMRNGSLQITDALEEVDFLNGSGWIGTIRRVTLPLLSPSVFAAALLISVLTIRDVNEVILLYSPGSQVLSVVTWNFAADGSMASAATVGVLQTALMAMLLVVGRVMFKARAAGMFG